MWLAAARGFQNFVAAHCQLGVVLRTVCLHINASHVSWNDFSQLVTLILVLTPEISHFFSSSKTVAFKLLNGHVEAVEIKQNNREKFWKFRKASGYPATVSPTNTCQRIYLLIPGMFTDGIPLQEIIWHWMNEWWASKDLEVCDCGLPDACIVWRKWVKPQETSIRVTGNWQAGHALRQTHSEYEQRCLISSLSVCMFESYQTKLSQFREDQNQML